MPLLNDAVDAVDALAKVEKDTGLSRGVSARSRVIIVPRGGVVKGRNKNEEEKLSVSFSSLRNKQNENLQKAVPLIHYCMPTMIEGRCCTKCEFLLLGEDMHKTTRGREREREKKNRRGTKQEA